MTTGSTERALEGLRALDRHLDALPEQRGSVPAQLAMSIVLPGLPTLRRVPILGILLFALGVALPIVLAAWAYSRRADLVGFALDQRFLLSVVAVGLGAVIARLLSIAEVAHAFRRRPRIGGQTVIATVLVLALSTPVLLIAFRANEARGVVADVFSGGGGPALYVPDSTSPGTVDPEAVRTILLIGIDSGKGRWGARNDTMILVTIHEASGRTALISIPRNLMRLRFPPSSPLGQEFPDGFDDLANAVFTHVTGDPDLVAHYGRDGLQPEPVALVEGIGHSLGVQIDDFALVNMKGFKQVIDAVGGVTLELAQRVPLPPTLPGEHPLPSSVGPGTIEMDGTMAIAYVRSRSGDSDYQRMARQRQLLAALGSQVSPTDALKGFSAVTGVLGDSMRTSLSSGEFSNLLDRLGDNSNIQESVGLTPPLIQPGRPDYDEIKAIVRAVRQAIVTGEPSGYVR